MQTKQELKLNNRAWHSGKVRGLRGWLSSPAAAAAAQQRQVKHAAALCQSPGLLQTFASSELNSELTKFKLTSGPAPPCQTHP
jgi:hypothetical protein